MYGFLSGCLTKLLTPEQAKTQEGFTVEEWEKMSVAGKPIYIRHSKPAVGQLTRHWSEKGWGCVEGVFYDTPLARAAHCDVLNNKLHSLSIGFWMTQDASGRIIKKSEAQEASLTDDPVEVGARILVKHSNTTGEASEPGFQSIAPLSNFSFGTIGQQQTAAGTSAPASDKGHVPAAATASPVMSAEAPTQPSTPAPPATPATPAAPATPPSTNPASSKPIESVAAAAVTAAAVKKEAAAVPEPQQSSESLGRLAQVMSNFDAFRNAFDKEQEQQQQRKASKPAAEKAAAAGGESKPAAVAAADEDAATATEKEQPTKAAVPKQEQAAKPKETGKRRQEEAAATDKQLPDEVASRIATLEAQVRAQAEELKARTEQLSGHEQFVSQLEQQYLAAKEAKKKAEQADANAGFEAIEKFVNEGLPADYPAEAKKNILQVAAMAKQHPIEMKPVMSTIIALVGRIAQLTPVTPASKTVKTENGKTARDLAAHGIPMNLTSGKTIQDPDFAAWMMQQQQQLQPQFVAHSHPANRRGAALNDTFPGASNNTQWTEKAVEFYNSKEMRAAAADKTSYERMVLAEAERRESKKKQISDAERRAMGVQV